MICATIGVGCCFASSYEFCLWTYVDLCLIIWSTSFLIGLGLDGLQWFLSTKKQKISIDFEEEGLHGQI